jgi:hypothetical protein
MQLFLAWKVDVYKVLSIKKKQINQISFNQIATKLSVLKMK